MHQFDLHRLPTVDRLGLRFAFYPASRVPGCVKPIMSKLSAEACVALGKSALAFPQERNEPLENASHVRNAIVRFN